MKRALLPALLCMLAAPAHPAVSARDDAGAVVTLARPAQRVVSLAPHATELLYAAGGGQRIVGAVSHSDYPPEAQKLPRVGDNQQVDIERLLALRPDLLVVWRHDAASRQMEQLRGLGIPLYYSDPRRLADLPQALRQLGRLMGTGQEAKRAADGLGRRIEALSARYGGRPKVRVFYQVWGRPVYTLNDSHIVSDVIRICGGTNVFGSMTPAAPMLSAEAVLQADPEAIISGDIAGQEAGGVAIWKQYPALLAVKRNNLFPLSADLMNRPGPRIVDGAAQLCERLEQARSRRLDRN